MPFKDPEERRAYVRRYYARNRERVRERYQRWALVNSERVNAVARAWHAANLERSREGRRRRRAADPKRHREYQRKYRASNLEKVREATRRWSRGNLDALIVSVHRRRARISGNGGSHTVQEWREKVQLFAGCCAYCGESKPLTRDHRIPIVRGGTDNISNIVPACLKCNCSKGKRTDAEFIAAHAA